MSTTVKIVNKSSNPIPQYATVQSAGVDLYAYIDQDIMLHSLDRVLIPTGIYISLPFGHEAQIRPRSGNAFKYGLTVLNSPGTIDADYRGEIKILLVNLSDKPVTISNGDRIAQMVFSKYEHVVFNEVDDLDVTSRGEGGFGHTGK